MEEVPSKYIQYTRWGKNGAREWGFKGEGGGATHLRAACAASPSGRACAREGINCVHASRTVRTRRRGAVVIVGDAVVATVATSTHARVPVHAVEASASILTGDGTTLINPARARITVITLESLIFGEEYATI